MAEAPAETEARLAEAVALAWQLALEDPDRARALSEPALTSAEPQTRALAMRNLGYVEMTAGATRSSARYTNAAHDLLTALGDERGLATVEDMLTHLHLNLGAAELALSHALRTRELAERLDDPVLLGWALHNLGTVYHRLGDAEEGRRWYARALPQFEAADYTVGRARTLGLMADLELEAGRLDDARAHLAESHALWEASRVPLGLAHSDLSMAKLELAAVADLDSASDPEAIASAAQRALELLTRARSRDIRQPQLLVDIRIQESKAQLVLESCRPALDLELLPALRRAIAEAREHGLRHSELDGLAVQTELQLSAGDLSGAVETMREQLRLTSELAREDAAARARSLAIGTQIAAARREAEVTERLLLDVMPASIVRELKLHQRVDPKHHEHATVVFADLVGFTRISTTLEPRSLVAELDRLFRAFDDVAARWQLEKLKTIGDAYMAVAGLPDPHPRHALAATLAALHLREAVRAYAAGPAADGQIKPPWSVRVGLHSGPLIAGIIGRAKLAYDVWGETVNTAARMESSSAADRINVSAATHAQIAAYFVTTPRGPVEAKGLGPVDMFFVERIAPAYAADDAGLEPNAALLAVLAGR